MFILGLSIGDSGPEGFTARQDFRVGLSIGHN